MMTDMNTTNPSPDPLANSRNVLRNTGEALDKRLSALAEERKKLEQTMQQVIDETTATKEMLGRIESAMKALDSQEGATPSTAPLATR